MIFASGLLDGRRIALTGGRGVPIAEWLEHLGAWVGEAPANEVSLSAWVDDSLPLHALVHSASAADRGLDEAWVAARTVATLALIPGGGGRLVLIAPRPDRGVAAPAQRAALENLARTLSVEWARHRITAVAIWPGAHTTDEELATLVAYLVSRAGGYFTGCLFELGAALIPTS